MYKEEKVKLKFNKFSVLLSRYIFNLKYYVKIKIKLAL